MEYDGSIIGVVPDDVQQLEVTSNDGKASQASVARNAYVLAPGKYDARITSSKGVRAFGLNK